MRLKILLATARVPAPRLGPGDDPHKTLRGAGHGAVNYTIPSAGHHAATIRRGDHTAKTTTIDDLIATYGGGPVDFLKLDIDGAEEEVLTDPNRGPSVQAIEGGDAGLSASPLEQTEPKAPPRTITKARSSRQGRRGPLVETRCFPRSCFPRYWGPIPASSSESGIPSGPWPR